MKKTLLFVFALLFATATMAQNRAMILEESFDEMTLPEGWSVMDLGANNWSITATNQAGGEPNELQLFFYPQFNGTSRFVSPAVDLTGINSVIVSFKHNFSNYQGMHIIGIATSSDGGTTWNEGWSQSYNSSTSGEVMQEITTPDMGQANVQFCIFYTGNVYAINYWKFDDINIFTLENLDLGIQVINLPDFLPSGETEMSMKVINYGTTEVTSLQATYEVEGMEPVTEDFVVDIPSVGVETVTFTTPVMLIPNNYNVTFRINLVNGEEDDILDNNEKSKLVSVAGATVQCIPMIEHFSSSTCNPCVSVNNQMLNFCNNNEGRFTYTKYQMNGPGAGDPYYSVEGGTRASYYGIVGVPQCFLDGEDQGNAPIMQAVFDQHAEKAAFMDIRGSFVVDGNTITIVADIMPYITTSARVFVSVNEKVTYGNVGTNGETEFHHIFMKMLPDAEGTSVDFTGGELTRLEFTHDMTETFVEEMSDLEVSIWVQNYDFKKVFNSRYAYEYTDEHPFAVENLKLFLDEQAAENTLLAKWDAPALGNPTGYNVYVNGGLEAENLNDLSYSFLGEPGAFYTVGVVALYGEDKTSVMAISYRENTWSVEENEPAFCRVYPNPANSQVRIEAENDIESVRVYNILGALVQTISVNGQYVNINTANLSNGVYLFNIRQSDGSVSNRRVAVSH